MQPSTAVHPAEDPDSLPDHTQLPDKDGSMANSFQEFPQRELLTGSLTPRLEQMHPEGNYIIGMDSGIYWLHTDPPLNGCKSPDWYYVPGVSPMLDGRIRRSYVLWKEGIRPLIAIEYVSGDGSEEHDATPFTGKFWVYEQGICIPFYAIFDGFRDTVELYTLRSGRYEPVPANAAGRYPVEPLGVELGLWHALYSGMEGTWLRFWDAESGKMLPSAEERAEDAAWVADVLRRELNGGWGRAELERAELERERADAETKRADAAAERADAETKRADTAAKQAETEAKRATALQSQLANLHERLRAMGLDPKSLS
jgi:Uma2 family endonuclease